MYAIVDIAGQQFKVEKDQKIFVHRLDEKEGAKIELDKVLLVDDGEKVQVGEPIVSGIKIKATVLAHPKGDKVMVFKKKRRKGYAVLNGHRQYLTQLHIESIGAGSTTKKVAEKKEEVKKETKPTTAKASTAKKPAAATKTTTTAKASTTKKPASDKK